MMSPLLCDNTSAINFYNNPVMHSKTKQIAIKFHFFIGIGHREEHQVGIHWDKGIDHIYIHQASPKGDY